MNVHQKFKDEYTVAQILWMLKRAITQPVILDFLPGRKQRKLETGTNKNQQMTLLFEQTFMRLENDTDIHLIQEFRRKLIEIC